LKEEKEAEIEKKRRISLGLPLTDSSSTSSKESGDSRKESKKNSSEGGTKKRRLSPGSKKQKKSANGGKKNLDRLAGSKRSSTSNSNSNSNNNNKSKKSRKRSRKDHLRLDPKLVPMASTPLSLDYHMRYPGSGASILNGFQFSPDPAMSGAMRGMKSTKGSNNQRVTWTGGSMAGGGIPHRRTMLSVVREQQYQSNLAGGNWHEGGNGGSSSSAFSFNMPGSAVSSASLSSLSSLDSEASHKTIPADLRHYHNSLASVKGMLPFNTPTANGHITTTPLPTDKSTEEMLLDDICIVGHGIDDHHRVMLAEQDSAERILDGKRRGQGSKYVGQEVLGLSRHTVLPSDSIMRGGFRTQTVQSSTLIPTPVGFRSLASPTFDMWSMNETPARIAGGGHLYSPSSMLQGLEPFSPTTIREVDSMLMSDN
jgi:hypothetical protein